MRLLSNLLCHDIDLCCHFFQQLLQLEEITASRSPIYRALSVGHEGELGFNAPAARALLHLEADGPPASGTRCFATFMLDTPQQVDAAASQAQALGGGLIKAPFETYYGQWQTVLSSPEGHAFRVGSLLQG